MIMITISRGSLSSVHLAAVPSRHCTSSLISESCSPGPSGPSSKRPKRVDCSEMLLCFACGPSAPAWSSAAQGGYRPRRCRLPGPWKPAASVACEGGCQSVNPPFLRKDTSTSRQLQTVSVVEPSCSGKAPVPPLQPSGRGPDRRSPLPETPVTCSYSGCNKYAAIEGLNRTSTAKGNRSK